MQARRILLALALLLSTDLAVRASSPTLGNILPRGVQRGKERDFTEDATHLLFDPRVDRVDARGIGRKVGLHGQFRPADERLRRRKSATFRRFFSTDRPSAISCKHLTVGALRADRGAANSSKTKLRNRVARRCAKR